jgi:nucleotide-binding universal stress UspA family protein
MPGTQVVEGVDGSAAVETAVRWAVREARLRHAAVRLVCAALPPGWLIAELVGEPPARALIERAAGSLAMPGGHPESPRRVPVSPG